MGTTLLPIEDTRASTGRLTDRLGITEESLARRRDYIGLGSADQTILTEFVEWAKSVSFTVANDILAHQFNFAPTRCMFERQINAKQEALDVIREQLTAEQAAAFELTFTAAASNWNLDYFETRLSAGLSSAQFHSPLKWCLGSYPQLLRITKLHLKRSGVSEARASKVLESLNKVFSLDTQAIADSFVLNTLDVCGLDTSAVVSHRHTDRTEHFDQVQSCMSKLLKQSSALAEDRLCDTAFEREIPVASKLANAFSRTHERLLRIAEQADLLAAGDLRHSSLTALEDVDCSGVLGTSMQRLYRSLKQITELASDIGSGKMPTELEQRSDNDELIAAFNRMVFTIQNLMSDLNHVFIEHNAGETNVGLPVQKFEGAFREIARSINQIVESHIQVNKLTMKCVGELGRGNFEAALSQLPANKASIKEVIETVRTHFNLLVADTNHLAEAAASKNLSVRADVSRHQGDYRKIIEAINSTLDSLTEPLRITADNAATLAMSAEQLTASSSQMVVGAEETAREASTVCQSSSLISESVTSVAASSEEMLASIREISRNANEAARVAKSAVGVATATNRTISQLGESSREIGKVVKAITSIAKQTNLLALNATIEAARAGEAGKGFAVVANEVKELAKETAKATEEISTRIEAIQGDTQSAIRAIGEVTAIIGTINDVSYSIASAVEEQTATTNEIGRNVHDAARGTTSISQNIGSVARVANQTAQGAKAAQRAAQALTMLSSRMNDLAAEYQF